MDLEKATFLKMLEMAGIDKIDACRGQIHQELKRRHRGEAWRGTYPGLDTYGAYLTDVVDLNV